MAGSSSTSSSEPRPPAALWRRVGLRLVVFALLMALVDLGLGGLLARLHREVRGGDEAGRLNQLLERPRDIVIFGGSRAEHHYVPDIIARATGMSVFNAGFAAQSVLFACGVQQLVFARYQPRLLVLDINPIDLLAARRQLDRGRLSALLPFADEPAVRPLLESRSALEPLKLLSRLYRYNSQLLPLLVHTVQPDWRPAAQGYVPLRESRLAAHIAAKRPRPPMEGERRVGIDAGPVRAFVRAARVRGVPVVAVASPRWEHPPLASSPVERHLAQVYRRVLADEGVPFVDLPQSASPAFEEPAAFRDESHLTHRGALVFSELFAERLARRLPALLRAGGGAPAACGAMTGRARTK